MKQIFLIISIAGILAGCNRNPLPLKTGLEGQPLPSFDLLLIDSVSHFNTSQIGPGIPIVLFYFSPSCPYCRAEMQEIISGNKSLDGIMIYAISDHPYQELKTFYSDFQLYKYPKIQLGIDYKRFFAQHYNAIGIPYTAIYKKDKKLNQVFLGSLTDRQIGNIVKN